MTLIAYTIALLLAAMSLVSMAHITKVCTGNYCDPNWTPFDNMISALRGYNLRKGNPIQDSGDPGFLNQIFLPTKINSDRRVELETGITASELSYCRRSLKTSSFTTVDSYR